LEKDGSEGIITNSAILGFQLGCPVYRLALYSEHGELDNLKNAETHRQFAMLMARPAPAKLPMTDESSPALLFQNVAAVQTFSFLEEQEESIEVPAYEDLPSEFPILRRSSTLYDVNNPGVQATLNPNVKEIAKRESAQSSRIHAISRVDISGFSKVDIDIQPPVFTYAVYPIDRFRAKNIPTNMKHPQDLVFVVGLGTSNGHNLSIERITIQIPMAKKDNHANLKTLMAGYRGPGPVMLSNLRFNVLLSQIDLFLLITLLPRSRTNKVHLSYLKDCSFVLPLVEVTDYMEDITVEMPHIERYAENLRDQEGREYLHLGPE